MVSHAEVQNLANTVFLLWPQLFEVLVHYHRQPLTISSILQVLIDLCGTDWYHFLVCSIYYHILCFFEKGLWILSLFWFLSLLSWYFSYGNETRTQSLLIPRQKPNCFCHTDVMCSSWNLRLLNSSLFSFPWFMYVVDFTSLKLVRFLSCKQSSR